MEPETSVIVPVRNGARFVAEAIASALDQVGEGDEVLAVDDGSTDETPAILAGIADPRLGRLAGSARGVSAARNLGLAAARGAFIAFLDHDDLWPPGRHRGLLAALKRDEALDAVFGRLRLRFEPGAPAGLGEDRMDGRHICTSVCTGLYRRRLLVRAGGFTEELRSCEDTDFNLRLMEAGMRSRLCDIDALIYRRHDANTTLNLALIRRGRLEMIQRKLARARTGATAADGERIGDA